MVFSKIEFYFRNNKFIKVDSLTVEKLPVSQVKQTISEKLYSNFKSFSFNLKCPLNYWIRKDYDFITKSLHLEN